MVASAVWVLGVGVVCKSMPTQHVHTRTVSSMPTAAAAKQHRSRAHTFIHTCERARNVRWCVQISTKEKTNVIVYTLLSWSSHESAAWLLPPAKALGARLTALQRSIHSLTREEGARLDLPSWCVLHCCAARALRTQLSTERTLQDTLV